MEYEIINPSDPYRMEAEHLDTAAIAVCLLGDGQYAARPVGGGDEVPVFLFESPDPWFASRFGASYIETAKDVILRRGEELARVLDSVALRPGRERSSLNDIGARAKALAEAVRRKAAEVACTLAEQT